MELHKFSVLTVGQPFLLTLHTFADEEVWQKCTIVKEAHNVATRTTYGLFGLIAEEFEATKQYLGQLHNCYTEVPKRTLGHNYFFKI